MLFGLFLAFLTCGNFLSTTVDALESAGNSNIQSITAEIRGVLQNEVVGVEKDVSSDDLICYLCGRENVPGDQCTTLSEAKHSSCGSDLDPGICVSLVENGKAELRGCVPTSIVKTKEYYNKLGGCKLKIEGINVLNICTCNTTLCNNQVEDNSKVKTKATIMCHNCRSNGRNTVCEKVSESDEKVPCKGKCIKEVTETDKILRYCDILGLKENGCNVTKYSEVCVCDTDSCNSSQQLLSQFFAFLFAILVTFLNVK